MRHTFKVTGLPKGQPRVKAFRRGNHAGVYDPGTADGWKLLVREAAYIARPSEPLTGPVTMKLAFTFPRPKSHFLKAGLRPNAPTLHTSKPDADNLAKAVLDAMGDLQCWWKDDAQVALLSVRKGYGETAGVFVEVEGVA